MRYRFKIGSRPVSLSLFLLIGMAVLLLACGEGSAADSRFEMAGPGTPSSPTLSATREPTAAPAIAPPANLYLAPDPRNRNDLTLDYTSGGPTHYYWFELHRLNQDTGYYFLNDTELHSGDGSSLQSFTGVARGYWYKARGKNCANSSRSICSDWSDWSPLVEFSEPQADLAGLESHLTAGQNYPFVVELFDLTLGEDYTVTVSVDDPNLGFDPVCSSSHSTDFTPDVVNDAANPIERKFTFYACDATEGVATVELTKTGYSGVLASATIDLKAAEPVAFFFPEPGVISVNQTLQFTLFTNVARVWLVVNGPEGQISLDEHCSEMASKIQEFNDGDTVTITACSVGEINLQLLNAPNSQELASYQVEMSEPLAFLYPEPSAITVGETLQTTLLTNTSGVWLGVNYGGDHMSLDDDCSKTGVVGTEFYNGNTVTIKGCSVGTARIRLLNANTALRLLEFPVTVIAADGDAASAGSEDANSPQP